MTLELFQRLRDLDTGNHDFTEWEGCFVGDLVELEHDYGMDMWISDLQVVWLNKVWDKYCRDDSPVTVRGLPVLKRRR